MNPQHKAFNLEMNAHSFKTPQTWEEECNELCQELGFDLEDVYQQKLPPLEQTWEEEFQQLAIELDQLIN